MDPDNTPAWEPATAHVLFSSMEPQVLDALCARLKRCHYIEGTVIVKEGYPVSRIFFIVRGELQSVAMYGGQTGYMDVSTLGKGDIVGEELMTEVLDKIVPCLLMRSGRSMRLKSARMSEWARFGLKG